MGFKTIVPEEVSNEWGWIQPLFKQAVLKSGAPDDTEQVYQDCLDGKAFIGINDDRTAALLINIHEDYPEFLNWHYTGALKNTLKINELQDYLHSFKTYGVKGIIAGGRVGWLKYVKMMGFDEIYINGKNGVAILNFHTGET